MAKGKRPTRPAPAPTKAVSTKNVKEKNDIEETLGKSLTINPPKSVVSSKTPKSSKTAKRSKLATGSKVAIGSEQVSDSKQKAGSGRPKVPKSARVAKRTDDSDDQSDATSTGDDETLSGGEAPDIDSAEEIGDSDEGSEEGSEEDSEEDSDEDSDEDFVDGSDKESEKLEGSEADSAEEGEESEEESEEGSEEESEDGSEADSQESGSEECSGKGPPPRPSECPRLAMWDFNQCNVKACSGRKLKNHGKIIEIHKQSRFRGIILCADAKLVVSPSDREIVEKSGICVIDCSWNRVNEVPMQRLMASGKPRKLPYFVAANPCHFGKPYDLNCAEALAATLFITGYYKSAAWIMQSFKWGHSFFKVNELPLDSYTNDEKANHQQILEISNSIEKKLTKKKKKK